MSALAQALQAVKIGQPQAHRNLGIFPLFGTPEGGQSFYLRLDEALGSGQIRITEVSEAGSVPSLKLTNAARDPALLLDGEELVGCKQNRVINVSILAPADSTLDIPVSCVEQGRWSARSDAFSAAPRTQYATGRAHKVAQVSRSLYADGIFASDQGEVWSDLQAKQSRLGVSSRTSAMADLYEARERELQGYTRAFEAQDGQIGAVFTINGKAVGIEIFDSPSSLAAYLPKVVTSYALDAIDYYTPVYPVATASQAEGLLHELEQAETSSFPGVGLGENLRLEAGADLVGAGLIHEGRLVHLCGFRLTSPEHNHRRLRRDA